MSSDTATSPSARNGRALPPGAPWLVSLERAAELAPGLVGPKAHNLGRLRGHGLPVPAGFVLTAELWGVFARAAGLDERLRRLADDGASSPGAAAAAELRAACLEAPLPPDLPLAVERGLAALGAGRVAVRSSALAEDGVEASGAGLFRSLLDRQGAAQVLEAIRACWASQFSDEALAYRRDRRRDDLESGMAVIVQAMVQAEAAGVLFSQAGEEGGVLVEAVPGLGQALVDGQANPARWVAVPGRAPELRGGDGDLIGAEHVRELARTATRAEALLDGPVDVEWALAGGALWLLQARPITAAARAGGQGRIRWTAANTQEALLDPVTPLTWSLFEPLVEHGRRDLFRAAGFAEIPGPGYMRLFYGRPYFNPDYFRRFLEQVPGAPTNIFDALIFGEGPGGIELHVPSFGLRTVRLLLLYVVARLGARERFELFQRLFTVRLGIDARRDLTRLSDRELVDLRRRATRLLEAALRRHVLGTAISGAGYLLLDLLLRRTGADASFPGRLVSRLTAGASGNALALSSIRLEELAREAARRPALPDLLDRLPREGWRAELAAAGSDGRWLLAELERYLARYGHRAEKEAELAEPRWADDPTVLIRILASFVRAAEGEGRGLRHLRQREASLTRRARRLARRVGRRLTRQHPLERVLPLRRTAFALLLREARRYAPYRENLKDRALRALHLVRRVFLEAGERLARRGHLERGSDVFYLEVAEVEEALLGTPGPELARRVARRRAERAGWEEGQAPRYVIEVPGEPPLPIQAAVGRGELVEGVGVSGGKVRGTARVLRSMEDAGRLAPGEVIVARVVNAGWTPLFHLAGGIVAEVGGVLSHAAIVAREYGLPAVFGAEGATSIPDGAQVCVDGDLGIVTVEG